MIQKKRKNSCASVSNQIFKEFETIFLENIDEYNTNSTEINEYINEHFHWEKVSYLSPIERVTMTESVNEWRLKYRIRKGLAWKNHIFVQESTIIGAGNGLYADRTFVKDDIISVYMGKVSKSFKQNCTYKLAVGNYAIDGQSGIQKGGHMYLGCHLANDIIHREIRADGRKNYNARFVETCLVAMKCIEEGTEIFVNYNRGKKNKCTSRS